MSEAPGRGRGRRARALAFFAMATLAAVAAATIVAGYGSRMTRGYGALRRVVVLEAALLAGRPIGPHELASALDVRRVPERFVPAGALLDPGDALGLVPRGPVPAGSYLLAAQLRPPRAPRSRRLGGGRRPVEIAVSGADALLAAGRAAGRRVDVVVTSEPSGTGPGRTYVAAEGVPLLAIGPGEDGPVPGGTAAATLGLTRRQALRLIAAESFARKLTLLPEGIGVSARRRHVEDLASALRDSLIERRRAAAASGTVPAGGIAAEVASLVEEEAALLGAADREAVAARILRDTIGLGPLEELLADPRVEEVMVNGPDAIYVEREGRIEPTAVSFESEEELRNAIERILSPLGRRVDELSPMVDARLDDGSRVNVVIPPLSIDGPVLSIRRFGARRPGPDRLVELGTLSRAQRSRLREAVAGRRSILISGGTGSGKTTLLNAVSSFIAPGERVVTIEDAAELRLQQPHVVRLESRPSSVEGRGEVTIRDLLRNALRMRPDRIVIGEVRGPEGPRPRVTRLEAASGSRIRRGSASGLALDPGVLALSVGYRSNISGCDRRLRAEWSPVQIRPLRSI